MESLINSPEDVRWLRETHLAAPNLHNLKPADLPTFESALLTGNEDCPDAIALYADREPLFHDSPVMVLELHDVTRTYFIRKGA